MRDFPKKIKFIIISMVNFNNLSMKCPNFDRILLSRNSIIKTLDPVTKPQFLRSAFRCTAPDFFL